MCFKLYSYSTGEPVETVEMHVLAKAYRAAWRSVHAREPGQCHVLAAVDLVIDFEDGGPVVASQAPTGADAVGERGGDGGGT
jgi:CelD/BcsL family acetyltransferase involved in cellulose biosynthesis